MKKTFITILASMLLTTACAQIDYGRRAEFPDIKRPTDAPPEAFNDRKEEESLESKAISYVELPEDVLRPRKVGVGQFPDVVVGPYEIRSENLGSALQLILEEYNISIAFETEEALSRRATIIGLRGKLKDVVERLCSSVDLYCGLERDTVVVKEKGIFSVSMPPLGTEAFSDISGAISAITGGSPIIDNATRTMTYQATDRTNLLVEQYFERLRLNTALIVFETYIWEVTLNNDNSFGIQWDRFNVRGDRVIGLPNSIGAVSAATSGQLGYNYTLTKGVFDINAFVTFLATQGAVKTISRPQISVLSGGTAKLKIGEKRRYVNQTTTTITGVSSTPTTSFTTDNLETGLEIEISSAWDESTVYSQVKITQSALISLLPFGAAGNEVQLPRTSERELETQIRVRPGDSVIMAGLVTERDDLNRSGLGIEQPIIPFSSTEDVSNSELVFVLSPRVIIYKPKDLLPVNAIDLQEAPPEGQTLPETTDTDITPAMSEKPESVPELGSQSSESVATPAEDATDTSAIDTGLADAPMQSPVPNGADAIPADTPIVDRSQTPAPEESESLRTAPYVAAPVSEQPERDPLEQRSLLSSIQAMSSKLSVSVIPVPPKGLLKTGVPVAIPADVKDAPVIPQKPKAPELEAAPEMPLEPPAPQSAPAIEPAVDERSDSGKKLELNGWEQ